MKTKNEDIIRKLFESKCSLSPEERAALNNYEYVNDTFHRQWEEMSEEAVDLVREEKILNGIMNGCDDCSMYGAFSFVVDEK